MAHYDAANAEVQVYSYKEGLLSAMAHDLRHRVAKFSVDVAGDSVTATFDASSLEVASPQRDGVDNPGLLPKFTWAEIEKNVRNDVLHSAKHREIRFVSSRVTDAEVVGQLTLHGVTREVRCVRRDEPGAYVAEAWLDQPDFGIKPYSAMLGTLKVQPKVKVVVRLKKEAA